MAGFYQALINQYAIPILDKQPVWTTKEFIPIGYIDTQDAASICLKSLFLKTTENETFFLLGPETWFSNTIIQICEKFSGQKAKIKVKKPNSKSKSGSISIKIDLQNNLNII